MCFICLICLWAGYAPQGRGKTPSRDDDAAAYKRRIAAPNSVPADAKKTAQNNSFTKSLFFVVKSKGLQPWVEFPLQPVDALQPWVGFSLQLMDAWQPWVGFNCNR